MRGESAVHWTFAVTGILIALVAFGVACVIFAPVIGQAQVWLLRAMGFPK